MADLRKIRILCGVIAILTLLLVALGGFVRATGAGLSCPDWPLCFGQVIPEFIQGVTQEYIHRVLAAIVGGLTLVLVFKAYKIKNNQPRFFRFSVFLLFLVTVQAVFGGLTVTMKLHPHIVTTHLILGTIFFLLVGLVAIERISQSTHAETSRLKKSKAPSGFVGMLTFFTFLQIALGGFVGSSGASLSCPDFPFCFGEVVPQGATTAQIVQMLHRGLGFVIFFGALWLLFVGSKRAELGRQGRGHIFGMVFLIGLQICIGAMNVWLRLPIVGTVLHLVVAQMILLGLTSLFKELNGSKIFFSPILDGDPSRRYLDLDNGKVIRKAA